MKTRSIKFFQRNAKTRTDGVSYQLPVTFYLQEEKDHGDTAIKVYYAEHLNMCIPYLAIPNAEGTYMPLSISYDFFPKISLDSRTLHKMKMIPFRSFLPPEIARQYQFAELLKIPGFDNHADIESGAVIRGLLNRYEERVDALVDEFQPILAANA